MIETKRYLVLRKSAAGSVSVVMQAISELKSCVRKILFSEKRQKKLDFQ
jgi:hypothetical protein